MKALIACIWAALTLSGCASQSRSNNILLGMGLGAATGAFSGSSLSPNQESKSLNAIVFGLSGALIGGAIGYLSDHKTAVDNDSSLGLKDREKKIDQANDLMLPTPISGTIPDFLKDRLTGLVIEEMEMPSQVGEDGTLHEPHKAYRIKQSPELIVQKNTPKDTKNSRIPEVKNEK